MRIRALLQLAQSQLGAITRSQAMQFMSEGQFHYLVETGVLERCWPSVYTVTGSPSTWHQRAMAAVLSVPGSALSHRSAARLWGLMAVSSERIQITAPRFRPLRREGVTVHRSSQLDGHVVQCGVVPVTSVARTLVDLSTCLDVFRLGRALDEACNLGLVQLQEVQTCLDRMVTRGRSRISVLRDLLAARDITDERVESFLERKVLEWIRSAMVGEPEAQYWVVANGRSYRLDFAFPFHKVAVEADGPHHLLATAAADDRRRDADLALSGWIVLHATSETPSYELISRLRAALQARRPDVHSPLNSDKSSHEQGNPAVTPQP